MTLQYWKCNQTHTDMNCDVITMATCMLLEGEDSLPTKCYNIGCHGIISTPLR